MKSGQLQFGQAHAPTVNKRKVTKSTSCLSRELVPSVEWDKCIFCQGSGGNLSQVLTFGTSSKILEASEADSILDRPFADISDLVSPGRMYHLMCYAKAL